MLAVMKEGSDTPGKRPPSAAAPLAVGMVVARRLVLLAAVWTILTGGEALALGIPAVAAACWLSLRLLPAERPLRLTALARMAPGFAWRSLVGGLDVARRALDPRMPLDPGWIEVPVDLPGGGRVALGGELSLMPGTLAAGSEGGRLLVHMLDRTQDIEPTLRTEEARLGRASGPDPGDGG